MKTYTITEIVPSITTRTFKVEAIDEEEALKIVMNGDVDPISVLTEVDDEELEYCIEE